MCQSKLRELSGARPRSRLIRANFLGNLPVYLIFRFRYCEIVLPQVSNGVGKAIHENPRCMMTTIYFIYTDKKKNEKKIGVMGPSDARKQAAVRLAD